MIVDGKVATLKDINILTSKMEDNKQAVILSFEALIHSGQAAVILPFPEGECSPLDMDGYERLFDQLDRYCWNRYDRDFGPATPLEKIPQKSTAEHKKIQYVIVSCFEELANVPADFHTFSEQTSRLLQQNYSRGFGFIVCKLEPCAAYLPFGYTCNRMRDGKLFIPTRATYQGPEGGLERQYAMYDHTVYVYNGRLVYKVSEQSVEMPGRDVARALFSAQYGGLTEFFGPCNMMSCWKVVGVRTAIDLLAT